MNIGYTLYPKGRNKLSAQTLKSLIELYKEGWGVANLGKLFFIHHTTVIHHVRQANAVQEKKLSLADVKARFRNEELKLCELDESYRKLWEEKEKNNAEKDARHFKKSNYYELTSEHMRSSHFAYSEIAEKSRDRSIKDDAECVHQYWTKRCSICNTILESDAIDNSQSLVLRDTFNSFDKLVPTLAMSRRLARAGARQVSYFYWAENKEAYREILRSKDNIELYRKDYDIYSAYTAQELAAMILRLKDPTDDVLFQIGKNANSPTELAKILLAYLKQR